MEIIWLMIGVGLAALIEIGHATLGKKQFLRPALSDIGNNEARVVLNFVWHLADVAFVIIIIVAGLTAIAGEAAQVQLVGWVAGAFFGALGVMLLGLGLRSGIKNAPVKIFQWILFLAASAAFLLAAMT